MPPRNAPRQRPTLRREVEINHEVEIRSVNWSGIADDFDNMGLKKNLLRGVYAYGLEKPAPVQQRAIVPLLKGRDVIMQAQSGTGKTAAFVIAILQQLDISIGGPQALILAPTRELALQIQKVVLAIGQFMNVKCCVCIGGRKTRHDIQKLESGVHIVVGTSGRVLDLMKRDALKSEKIKILIIDEADEMLQRKDRSPFPFRRGRPPPPDATASVLKRLRPQDMQVVFLSATIEPSSSFVRDFMQDPVKILVKKEQLTLEGIQQFFIIMTKDSKLETLSDLYTNESFTHPTVVFCNTRKKVDELSNELGERELPASATHGKKPQGDRESRLQGFRTGSSKVLITTDMLSRGIDVQQVAVVVNYDLPKKKEIYMHRIGRSGRFGRKGIAINFVTQEDIGMLRDIEQYYSTQIEEMPMDISNLIGRMSLNDG